MLTSPADFARVSASGLVRSDPLLLGRFARSGGSETRFGFATSRRLGGAVVRNRVRRRLREALRALAPALQPGWDVLIVARPALVTADRDALGGALRRVLGSAGVVASGGDA